MHKARLCFQWLGGRIVNAPSGANKARARLNLALTQLFGSDGVRCPRRHGLKGIQMKTKTSTLQTGTSIKFYLAVAATALALLAIPHAGHAQGVFRGAEQGGREGVREGGRAAGPVGAVVGGAIGTGVGAAVGGVRGVLGVDRGRRCRGYYTRRGYFRCYR
jgi:hypothetical protein